MFWGDSLSNFRLGGEHLHCRVSSKSTGVVQSLPNSKDQGPSAPCTDRTRPDQLRSQQVFGVLAASAGMSWQLCMGGLQPYLRRHQRVASDRGAIEMGVGPLRGAGLQHAAHSVRYRYLAIGPGQRCAARDRWPADPLRRHLPALASLRRSEPHRPPRSCCCGHLDVAGVDEVRRCGIRQAVPVLLVGMPGTGRDVQCPSHRLRA